MAVLLTRAEADSRRIAGMLSVPQDQILVWPLFETDYRAAQDPGPDTDALLFTSAHGVHAFARSWAGRSLPALCVGDRTAEVARALGFAQISSAGGTADDLARLAGVSGHTRFLYPRGQDVSVDLAGMLRAQGLTVAEQIVYAACPAGPPGAAIDTALVSGSVRLITVWSAAAASRLGAVVDCHPKWSLDQTDLLAISGKTAAALADAKSPFRRIVVAQMPNAAGMIEEIHAALR